jgi:hypothetical protein
LQNANISSFKDFSYDGYSFSLDTYFHVPLVHFVQFRDLLLYPNNLAWFSARENILQEEFPGVELQYRPMGRSVCKFIVPQWARF